MNTQEKIIKGIKYLDVTVKDKGIGISNDDIDDIFDPFTRVNKNKNEVID